MDNNSPNNLPISRERPMNTSKIETLIGLLATAFIAIGLFLTALNEPGRIAAAQQAQIEIDLDEAMTLYAQNCSVCHGLAGEGIGATPPLDNEALRSSDSESLFKIIARGLYGTAMPAWSKEDGGPLSDYQIREIVTLVQNGDWQATQERVVNLGLAPLVPFTAEPDPAILSQVSALPQGDLLTKGIQLYASQCVACHGADGKGTSLAPALNDPAVREKPSAELERIIRNGVSGTLMAGWENALNSDDLNALLTLILNWDQIPEGAVPAPDKPIPVTEESLALGADLYAQSCARCHGADGQGTRRAPALNVKGYLTDTNDAALQQIITQGVPGTAMPSWGDRLSEAEIQAVVGFIRSWEPNAPEVAEPARGGGGPWWQSGGSTPSGQSNGPPWKRNSSSSSSGSQPLPSGGSGQPHATPPGNQSSQNNGQGNNNGAQAAPGQNQAGAQQNNHAGEQGIPPWAKANEAEPQTPGFDWRAIALLFGVLLSSFALMGAGLVGLKRQPVE